MADNVPISPGNGGAVIATDDVAGVQFQIVKLDVGAGGASAPVVGALPITADALPLPSGAATETTEATVAARLGDVTTPAAGSVNARLAAIGLVLPGALAANGGMKVELVSALSAASDSVTAEGLVNTTLAGPTSAVTGDTIPLWLGAKGTVGIHGLAFTPINGKAGNCAMFADATGATIPLSALGWRWNGSTMDPEQGNRDITAFASADRTATPTPYDGLNVNMRGLYLVIDCTVATGSPSVVFTLQGKDVISGKFYTILASAAIVGTGTTVMRVYPGLTAIANLTASDILPRQYRVIATHGNTDHITYSVGQSLIV
jgi:hypothetical protein